MNNWQKINEKTVYKGYREVIRKTFIMPDGRKEDFDIITNEDAIGIIGLTPENNVILVRQFRPGTEEVYDEIPAGFIDKGESPLDTAKRELLEETGYEGEITYVATTPIGAYKTTKRHAFIALNCKKTKNPTREENEFIELIIKPLNEFKKQLRKGELTDTGLAYLGMDYLKLL